MSDLTHLDDTGAARMVDVSNKAVTARESVAEGRIAMSPAALTAIREGAAAKGDVLAVARVAGIMAAKKTADLIPLCHSLPLSRVTIDFAFNRDGGLPVVSKWVAGVSVRFRTPVAAIWTGAILEILFVWLAESVSIGGSNIYTITVNATLIFLFLSFTVPIVAGAFAIGGPKWPHMGPWNIGIPLYRLFAVLSVLGMLLIVFIAVQPPNGQVLWITLAFLVLAAILWFGFENRRFQGPPVGEMIAKRQAEIAAIEARFGGSAAE